VRPGPWVRVSTGGQDEQNQVPDVDYYCTDHQYQIVRTYELNDKSASKGEQQSKLDEMIEDMRQGVIKVCVAWWSDRFERRGVEALFRLLRQAKDAGGRLESVNEPLFGAEDMSGEVWAALSAVMAHQEAVQIGINVTQAHDRSRGNGAIYAGTPPWGFTIEGPRYEKRYVPTELCRRIVPIIFDMCIVGESLTSIAKWLDSQGVPTTRGGAKWSAATVLRILHNRAYAGRVINRQGVTISYCEAVISADKFDRANEALKRRLKRGPTAARHTRPTLATLKCARCGSPMYRHMSGQGNRWWYYVCAGSGPQRKGCGNHVPYDNTETVIAVRIFLTSQEPRQSKEWIEGVNWDNEK
jgi:DNA invertase Pin-like site-specific DNA recombinase